MAYPAFYTEPGSFAFLAGCVRTEEKEVTGEKLDFTVVPPEEIPGELKSILDANKESEMMISYRIGEYLYIIRGYGKQETGGCSIAVDQVLLAEDGIHFSSTLMGPDAGEEIPKGILLSVCGDQTSLAGTGSIF
ncbi:MAG: protease complex subunit PrcB family protein [Blautia sp.]